MTVSATATNTQGVSSDPIAPVTLTITDDDGAPTLSIDSPSVTEGNSGTTTLTFTVTLSTASGQQVTVNYAEGTGTATAGQDYTALTSGTLTFEPGGNLSQTIDVTVNGDNLDEPNETVIVQLSNPINATISTGTGTGTITDDDDAPSLSISSSSVAEGDEGETATLSFEVTLSAASGQIVTVNFAEGTGTATAGEDYTALTPGTLTFNPGERTKTIDVTVNGDNLDEPNETVVIQLSNPGNATLASGTATGEILDDDPGGRGSLVPPTASINSPTVTEGNEGETATLVFKVMLNRDDDEAAAVSYAASPGTATADEDYVSFSPGRLAFAPGETSQSITVTVNGDNVDEPDETVMIELSDPDNLLLSGGTSTATATGTIIDDDAPPSVTLSLNPTSISENGGVSTVTATLSHASSAPTTVNLTTTPGAGATTSDYTLSTNSITIAAGTTTGTATITAVNNTLDAPNKTVTVSATATNTQGVSSDPIAPVTLTITDDDGAPTLSIDSPSVTEGNSGTTIMTFTVTLSTASGQQVTVNYAEGTGTATAGQDYTALTDGTLTFNPGGNLSQTIDVTVNGDNLDEPNETVVVELSGAVNATLSTATGTGTIIDDDDTPETITLTAMPTEVTEDGGGRIVTVTATVDGMSRFVADQVVTISVEGSGFAAVDDFTITIPANTASAQDTFTLTPVNDVLANGDETVTVSGTVASPSLSVIPATVTIRDDDIAPTGITLTAMPTEVAEDGGGRTVTVTATVDGVSRFVADQVVTVSVSGSGFAAVNDFTVTIPANTASAQGMFTLTPVNDALDNPDRTVTVSGAVADPSVTVTSATVTIRDDDGAPTLSISSPSIAEGDDGETPMLTFEVFLSAASGQIVTVNFAEDTGTATAGEDYTALTAGTLTFNPGDRLKTIDITITGDDIDEPNETVVVQLSDATNATIATGTGTGTITDDDDAPTLSITSPSVTEGNEGETATLSFEVTLSAASGQIVTVNFAEGTGTATAGEDYTALTAGTLTFNPGDRAKTIDVTVTGDDIDEPDETVVVQLSDATNATMGLGTGTGTITDDDDAPAVTLSLNPTSISENGGVSTVTATLSHASSAPTTVNLTTTPGAGVTSSDYILSTNSITIAAGTTTGTATITAEDNSLDAPDKTVTVSATATNTQGVSSDPITPVTLIITDDDAASSLSIDSPSVTEGNSGTTTLTFTVTLSPASGQTVAVNWGPASNPGTATPGTDYQTITGGTLTFAPGAPTTQMVSVTVIGDNLDEPNETVVVELSGAANATIGTGMGTGTITDDDATPETITLTVVPTEVAEDGGGRTMTVTATVDGVSRFVADQVVTISVEGSGFAAVDNFTITIPANTASTQGMFTLRPVNDAVDNPDRTVTVSGEVADPSVTVTSAVVTIRDDDGATTLLISSPMVAEGGDGETPMLTFEVFLSAASGQIVTVNFAEGTGTATADTDYTALTAGTLTFNPGDRAKTITVTVNGDDLDEPDETVVVELSNPTNATISTAVGTGTITDDDDAPTLSITSPSVAEGDDGETATLSFEVTLSAASGQTVTVNFAEGDGTATAGTDYTALTAGTLTFNPGDRAKTITVTVTGDDIDEPDETVVIALSNAVNATISTATGTGKITDDDATPTLSISSPSVTEGDQGETAALTFTVTLSAASGRTVTVNFTEGDGTATAGEDYMGMPAGKLTFLPGETSQTITVMVMGDDMIEPNEMVVIELSGATNATIGLGTGMIMDDDALGQVMNVVITEGVESLKLTWDAVPLADGYRVQWKFGNEAYDPATREAEIRGGDTTTHTEDNLTAGEECTMRVIATLTGAADGPPSAEVTGTPLAPLRPNGPPVADAGPDQTVAEGVRVTLDGSESSDPDSDSLTFSWHQIDGPKVPLDDASAMRPSFRLPASLPADTEFVFSLVVTDGVLNSDPDEVTVTATSALNERRARALKLGLAGFGRTVAAMQLDAISGRTGGARPDAGLELTLGGQMVAQGGRTITPDGLGGRTIALDNRGTGLGGYITDGPQLRLQSRLSPRDLLRNSSFRWTPNASFPGDASSAAPDSTSPEGRGGRLTVWGRTDIANFKGTPASDFQMDGEVISWQTGMDFRAGSSLLLGLAAQHSTGMIDYSLQDFEEGALDIGLTNLQPYMNWSSAYGQNIWGSSGLGWGTAELSDEHGAVEADLESRMVAGGARTRLFRIGELRLAAKADGFAIRIDAEAAELPDVRAEANRSRLALEAGWDWFSSGSKALYSEIELAGRRDGGDAEEGYGAEVGYELSFRHAGAGLEITNRGRLLVAHEAAEYEEWGASATIRFTRGGDKRRGLSLSLTPVIGTETSAADALWRGHEPLRRIALTGAGTGATGFADHEVLRRLNLQVGYGLERGIGQSGPVLWRPFAELSLAGGNGMRHRLRLGVTGEKSDNLRWQLRGDHEQRRAGGDALFGGALELRYIFR